MVDIPKRLTNIWNDIKPNEQRLNLIVDFFIDPCDAPVNVYIETLLPPLGEFALAWFTVSPQELAENYLKPNSASTCSKRKGRRRKGRRLPIINGADEVIADKLPGRGMLAARNSGFLTNTLFAANELVDRPLYWIMLFDLTEDLLYNWASGMIRTGFCQNKFLNVAKQWDSHFLFNFDDDWQEIGAVGPTSHRNDAEIGLFVWGIGGGPHKEVFSGTLKSNESSPTTIEFKVKGGEDIGQVEFPIGNVTVPANGTKGFTLKWERPRGGNYQISGNGKNTSVRITDMSIWAQSVFVN